MALTTAEQDLARAMGATQVTYAVITVCRKGTITTPTPAELKAAQDDVSQYLLGYKV